MEKHIYDEKNGLNYTLNEDGFYYPDIALPEQKYEIGRFGLAHADYLKKHKKVVYREFLFSGRLNDYLHDIDVQAQEMFELLMRQYAKAQGVTEQLKSENQMAWVGKMNNIKACVEEVIFNKLIYN